MTTDTPEFVDSLPYIDTVIDDDEDVRTDAMKEVDDEIDRCPPSEYFWSMAEKEPDRPFCSPLMIKEFEAIEQGVQRLHPSELSKLVIPPKSSDSLDLDNQFDDRLKNLKIKLEYGNRRLFNLDSLKNVASSEWTSAIQNAKIIVSNLDNKISELNQEIDELNKRRKADQEKTLKVLEKLEKEQTKLMDQNDELFKELTRYRFSNYTNVDEKS